jgi:diadenosine tetraphosphate (Ap4A) HIT family hydrolase
VSTAVSGCSLCNADGGLVLWRDAQLRVVDVADADYPGLLRVICNAHVREWSDLDAAARTRMMAVVELAEQILRLHLAPDKVNLASLGNLVPHLHWHIVPRFTGDAHFPDPIWGPRRRDPDPALLARQHAAMPLVRETITRQLALPA